MDRASRYLGIMLGALIVIILVNFALAFTIGIGIVPDYELDLPTPLMKSAELGLVDDVRQLIRAGAAVNKKQGQSFRFRIAFIVEDTYSGGRGGRTALMYAAGSRSIKT